MIERIEVRDGLNIIPMLFGPQDTHRKLLERGLGVQLSWRDPYISISGELGTISQAQDVITTLLQKLYSGEVLFLSDMQRIMGGHDSAKAARRGVTGRNSFSGTTSMGMTKVSPKSDNQAQLIKAIENHDLVFCSGPAGTGKTFLAMAAAIRALQTKAVDRIVLTRPAVEAGERLGFLPGSLVEKVNPYLRPLFDALFELVGPEPTAKLMASDELEIAPLAFMRGRTLARSFIILDESQNTSIEQMRMFLTRIGRGSKAVVTGDPTQTDLPIHQRSGFEHALNLLGGVDGIATVRLDAVDVVRHRLVRDIIHAYEQEGGGV